MSCGAKKETTKKTPKKHQTNEKLVYKLVSVQFSVAIKYPMLFLAYKGKEKAEK